MKVRQKCKKLFLRDFFQNNKNICFLSQAADFFIRGCFLDKKRQY